MAVKKAVTPFFDGIKTGLIEAIEHARGGAVPVTVRNIQLPDPPKPMSAREIAQLRRQTIGVSQRVFAGMLNASMQTVHAWEQGRAKPTGPTLRLLRVIQRKPELIQELVQ